MIEPIKLNKSPLVESLCEIRFNSNLPLTIVPGILSTKLELTELENLPILDFPETIRNADPNLLYAPYYKAMLGNIQVQLGARVISLSSPIPYIGWDEFRPVIEKAVGALIASGVATKINRVANKSVNFFHDHDILKSSTFNVTNPIDYECKQYQHMNVYNHEDQVIRTTLLNEATYNNKGNTPLRGSIIDIDSYIEIPFEVDKELIMSNLDKVHTSGKSIFFKFLNKDLLDSLEPVYE